MFEYHVDKIIKRAFEEDMNNGDVTTDNLIDKNQKSEAVFVAKERGVIAGIDISKRTFEIMDASIEFKKIKEDGDLVDVGDKIAVVIGSTRAILKAERTALNLLQRMSGIATMTKEYANEIKDFNTFVVDTRKTTPGLRIIEKYAVKVGGGRNHRFNLSDAVMIKDNHIKAAGGIKKAVEKIRKEIPHTTKIEVEVESIENLKEALDVKTDIIMLDNMSNELMKEAVKINKGRAILEASGNMTKERLKEVAETGVDVISVGALTHSVRAMDISLKFKY